MNIHPIGRTSLHGEITLCHPRSAFHWFGAGVRDVGVEHIGAAARFAGRCGERPTGLVEFRTRTDMLAMPGIIHSELAYRVDPKYTWIAILL